MSETPPVILLVEGDIVARHPLAEYLRDCGFTVFEAATGDAAMHALNSPDLQISIVLADMTTEGSGFPLRHWITENKPEIEVILAGTVEKAINHASSLCNEGPALVKPYEHLLVLNQIRQSLARRGRPNP